jgi:hypothetical protein
VLVAKFPGVTSIRIPTGAIAVTVDELRDGADRAESGSSLVLARSRPRSRQTEYVLRTARVTLGFAVTALSAVSRALDGDSSAVPSTSASDRSTVSLMPGAAFGLAANVAERGMDLATRVIVPAGRFLVRTTNPFTRSLEPYARRILVPLNQDWQVSAHDARAAAAEFGASLETQIVQAALQSLDITEIVRERVDLNSLVDEVDVARLVQEVLDDIDLPALIRESTGTLTADAIEEVRYVSVSADRTIARAVDRFIRRHRRHLDAPGEPTSLSSDHDEHRG